MSRTFRAIAALFVLIGAGDTPTRISAAGQDVAAGQAANANGVRDARTNNLYIVQMIEAPAGSYTGGVDGFRATKPRRGQKLNPFDPDVIAYAGYLDTRHNQALAGIGGGRKVYDYRYSFNGFAAELTPEQAAALRNSLGVVNVTKDELEYADTSSTPHFLGLDALGGLWEQVGGPTVPVKTSSSALWIPASGPRASVFPIVPGQTATPPKTAS